MGFDRMRIAYSGAAPISPDVLHFFQSIGVNLVEGYGQTEGDGRDLCLPCGKSENSVPLAPPSRALKSRLPMTAKYWLNPPVSSKDTTRIRKATAETIQDGWLYSGDVGEIDADGYLKITDRKKDIIVTAGGKKTSRPNILKTN